MNFNIRGYNIRVNTLKMQGTMGNIEKITPIVPVEKEQVA